MIVIDNAINPLLLKALWATWPPTTWRGWHHYSGRNAEKFASRTALELPSAAMPCLLQMVDKLEHETYGCFPDLELHGAGLHMLMPGGYLARHLDSTLMESTGWHREYSCVLHVNPEWDNSWGGQFKMNDQTVDPVWNRLVLFRTTDESIHEVLPVTGPERRCTLALFFWSQELRARGQAVRREALFL